MCEYSDRKGASEADLSWMRHALALAERGRGGVEPNPLVGAVLIRDGRVVGEGWHQYHGGPHAEIIAIERAGEWARRSWLYVSLEPCCHQGKTPPCTVAIIRAGIGRVIAAMADPNPVVDGKGFENLQNAGIPVHVGCMRESARQLNAPYLKLLTARRPYVHAKWAMSLDGKTAARSGDSKWITGEVARSHGHALRARMDGIVIGSGTARRDDPLLTSRPAGTRTLHRIVLTTRGDLPDGGKLLRTAMALPVIIATAAGIPPGRKADLEAAGCEVVELAAADGRPAVGALLDELGRRRMTNVLVEGGSEILGAFFRAGEIDECHVYVGSKLLGGRETLSPIGGAGAEFLGQASSYEIISTEMLGPDMVINARRGESVATTN